MKQNIVKNLHLLCMIWASEAVIEKNDSEYKITFKTLDKKTFYKAARPKRVEGFIETPRFMETWIENNPSFINEPPEVAIVYSRMKTEKDGIAHAIPIVISDPIKVNGNGWSFKLDKTNSSLPVGRFQDIALFIDWLPTPYCPEPIQALFPNLFN